MPPRRCAGCRRLERENASLRAQASETAALIAASTGGALPRMVKILLEFGHCPDCGLYFSAAKGGGCAKCAASLEWIRRIADDLARRSSKEA